LKDASSEKRDLLYSKEFFGSFLKTADKFSSIFYSFGKRMDALSEEIDFLYPKGFCL